MNLEKLIGTHLVVGLPGLTLAAEDARHLTRIQPGGFIAFARNFDSPKQFRALLDQLADALGYRPLVMVDHEGGRVVRFASGVTRFDDALTVGTHQQPDAAFRQGTIEAGELNALGVQVNLAPCVDVLVEGSDPIIGTRSYGRDPQWVSAMSVARIQGLQRGGVAACAKHFPGLGAVPKDPHRQLPTVRLEWPAMESVHLVPFQAAIATQVATIMSSHVCYPQIDAHPRLPATFSALFIRELLRQRLAFEGVILTDDLEMGALRELCPIGEAAVRAIIAGHDMVLVCSEVAAQQAVVDELQRAVRARRIPTAAVETSAARIERLREKFLGGS